MPRVTLHCGDALALLPRLRRRDSNIDALICDPPYSSGGLFKGDRAADPRIKYEQDGVKRSRPAFPGDNRDQRSWTRWCALWLGEALPLVREGGYVLLFTDWRQLPAATDAIQAAGFVWRGIVAWDKGQGARAPHKGYFRHQCEYILWGTKGRCPIASHAGPFAGCLHHTVRQADKFHLTGKPTQLMRELVQVVPRGSTILDAFMGSGTTLVAAVETGRHAVGIELDRPTFRAAKERIARAMKARARARVSIS